MMPASELPPSQIESLQSERLESIPRTKRELTRENTNRYIEPADLYGADLYKQTTSTRAREFEDEQTLSLDSETEEIARDVIPMHSYRLDEARTVPHQTLSRQQATVDISSVREAKAPPMLSIMESYGHASEPPAEFHWSHGAIVALIVLLFAGGVAIGGWYWWSDRRPAVQAVAESPTTSQGSLSVEELPSTSPTSKSLRTSNTGTDLGADEEFRSLENKRTSAQPSDYSKLRDAFANAEKKYPNDYRFPYERAKLSIVGVATHHEAFGALAKAAEEAIDNGKAQEMLDSLIADKDGDFYKLSKGHREWRTIEDALRDEDKASLKVP